MTRTEYVNPVSNALMYSNTVDGQYLIDSIVPQFDGRKWTVTYNIKISEDGWYTHIMDTGFHARGPDGQPYTIVHPDGTPLEEPVRLNGNGQPVNIDSDFVFNRGPYSKYPRVGALAALRIPDPRTIRFVNVN